MIISNLACGLGNQLFQYATGRRLAAKRGVPLKLELGAFDRPQNFPGLEAFARDFRLHAFNVTAPPATAPELDHFYHPPESTLIPRRVRNLLRKVRRRIPPLCRGMVISERGHAFEPGLLNLPDDVLLHGWWQNEKYFRDIAPLLREEFTLRDARLQAEAWAFVDQHRRPGQPTVSVHVRRGDVARAHEVLKDLSNMPYELLPKEYFQDAMSTFGDDATFLVFSDTPEDIGWCRANLHARHLHFSDAASDLFDFAAMGRCDHHVIANSSFSWWAAWLNPSPEKVVVAPQRWYRAGYAPEHRAQSQLPPAWIIR